MQHKAAKLVRRGSHRAAQTQEEAVFPPLRACRAHDVSGPSATSFAAIACGRHARASIWLTEHWQGIALNPAGVARFCDPRKILLARASGLMDILAAAEEALRSGEVPVVVAEISKEISFTAGRRLQLAAEAGKATGIFIINEGKGSNAAETRWHCRPLYDPSDSTLQRWDLKKNKSGTLGVWDVTWDATAHRINMVCTTGERAGAAPSAP